MTRRWYRPSLEDIEREAWAWLVLDGYVTSEFRAEFVGTVAP